MALLPTEAPKGFPLVSVTLVTFNSARYIERCLQSVLAQSYPNFEVIVVDNHSKDATPELLERHRQSVRIIKNGKNLGFAVGQNQAIAQSNGEWILTLNPDTLLHPDFVRDLVDASQVDSKVGCVCGKLLRIGFDFIPMRAKEIDSTGIFFTPNFRHLDRGWRQIDEGQYDRAEYVFGASAAAALYRREMINDVSHDDGFFDPDFFAYREDADVAWRAQLMGWRCLYTPVAVAHHVRTVVPDRRRSVSRIVNMHSVKNRFLMRIKNVTSGLYRRHWLAVSVRDLVVVFACLLWEIGSLPAFWKVLRCFPSSLVKRHQIMRCRTASDEYLAGWFQDEPSARPAPQLALRYATASEPQG